MSRVRSPNFPIIGLSKAIDRARTIFEKEQQLAANRDVLSKHLGYSGYNGKSAKVLSALMKYGLLEAVKDGRFRVSGRAMRILFPRTQEDRQTAINEAGAAPALFRDIANEYEGGLPSDENLANYLLHRGFSQSAIAPAIAAFRDTQSLVTRDQEQYDEGASVISDEDDEAPEDDEMDMTPDIGLRRDPGVKADRKPPAKGGEPFTLQFVKGGVLGSFDLQNKADLETLVAGLNALAIFLPEAPKADADVSESA
jgi:hypothetical protein